MRMPFDLGRAGKGTVLLAALALSGCGTHMGGKGHMTGPGGRSLTASQIHVLQTLDADGIRSQDKVVQVTKTCNSEPCRLPVKVSGTVTSTPGPGFDCQIGFNDSTLLFGKAVNTLAWTLEAPTNSENEYRFRPAPTKGTSPFAVYLYGDPNKTAFKVSVSDTRVELVREGQADNRSYLYGIYLDWRPKKGAPWQPCNALDPIIISHP